MDNGGGGGSGHLHTETGQTTQQTTKMKLPGLTQQDGQVCANGLRLYADIWVLSID